MAKRKTKSNKKKSGAKVVKLKGGAHEGENAVSAWKSTRAGIINILCAPFSGTKTVTNRKGEEKEIFLATVTNSETGSRTLFSCFVDSSYNVTIPDMRLYISASEGYVSKLRN